MAADSGSGFLTSPNPCIIDITSVINQAVKADFPPPETPGLRDAAVEVALMVAATAEAV